MRHRVPSRHLAPQSPFQVSLSYPFSTQLTLTFSLTLIETAYAAV